MSAKTNYPMQAAVMELRKQARIAATAQNTFTHLAIELELAPDKAIKKLARLTSSKVAGPLINNVAKDIRRLIPQSPAMIEMRNEAKRELERRGLANGRKRRKAKNARPAVKHDGNVATIDFGGTS
jgi:hypothetical protein